jgi:hypothetical protein
MRVIHDVPAPRELASMVRSFLYFQICGRISNLPQYGPRGQVTNLDRVIGLEVSWMRN